MNKLYVINWTIRDNYIISVSTFWSYDAMMEKVKNNPEWTFETIENNSTHLILKAS